MANENSKTSSVINILVWAFIIACIVWLWADSIFFAVIIIALGIYASYLTIFPPTPNNNIPRTPIYRPDGTGAQTLGETEYFCKIAGASHHDNEAGAFIGIVMSDPDNEYDKNAIAIYHNDGRLVGYIPRNEQKDFREWSTREPLPCVGFFCEGDYTDLYGKVKVIDADQRLTEIHIAKFVRWMVEKYGVKYIPNDFVVDSPDAPRTKAQWLDYLDEYIAQR